MFLAKVQSVDSFSEPANNSGWFDGEFYRDRWFLGARGTSGLFAIDYDAPTAPSVADSIKVDFQQAISGRHKGLCRIGSMVYVVCRNGSGTNNGFGIIEEFDVSDPTNIQRTGNIYDPHNSVPVAYNPGTSLTYLYSDIETDGIYLFVAGQKSGFYKFEAANLGQGPVASIEVTEDPDIETQGVAYYANEDLVVFANYTYGLKIIDGATWGQVVNHTVGRYDTGVESAAGGRNVLLRPWQVYIRQSDGWCFVCTNCSDPDQSSSSRGLLTINLGAGGITSLDTSDWNYAQIPAEYNDVWGTDGTDGPGDSPQLGVSVLGKYCYISNGVTGVLCWDITQPAAPSFVGLSGDLIEGDNLYMAKALKFRGQDVLVYGDGMNGTSGSKSLYFAEISHMSFTIGNYNPGHTPSGSSFVDSAANRGPSSTLDYTAVSGDEVTTIWYALHTTPPGNRTFKVGLYNVTQDTLVQQFPDISITTSTDPGEYSVQLATPVSLDEGDVYTVRATCSTLNFLLVDDNPETALVGRTMAASVAGDLNSDLTGDGAWANNNPLLALLGDSNVGILTTDKCSGLVVGKA